jgi:hypothetical protein
MGLIYADSTGELLGSGRIIEAMEDSSDAGWKMTNREILTTKECPKPEPQTVRRECSGAFRHPVLIIRHLARLSVPGSLEAVSGAGELLNR